MPRRKGSDSQSDRSFMRPNRERTHEVHCANCWAWLVAWFRTEEDADKVIADVERCGLCSGDTFERDNFKDSVIELLAQVTARWINRE